MVGKIVFCVASALFLVSLFIPAVIVGEERSLTGLQTFFYTLRYGTANVFGAQSIADFIVNFVALIAAAANFVFVFWAMLVFAPTRITGLKWFWWVSMVFLFAAGYTGLQVILSEKLSLQSGYFFWTAALSLMLVAPVVSRIERTRIKRARSRSAHKIQKSQVA